MNAEKKDNQTKLKAVIERITGEQAKVIAVPSELIHFTGKTQKAVFLAQLIYWSDRGTRPDKFIFKTRKEWTEETGLSESQIASYTKEFKKRGFLQTKNKKANGNPTIHYKIEFEVFLQSFAKFAENRKLKKLENQSEESEESLTENTTEITAENTSEIFPPYSQDSDESRRWDETQKKESSKTEGNVNGNVLQTHVDNGDQQETAGNKGEQIVIPDDFRPNLENQYQAVMKFSQKSPAHITKKFIEHYKATSMKKTLSGWQSKWWDWVVSDPNMNGHNREELAKEHYEIQYKIWNAVFRISHNLGYLIHRDEFYSATEKYLSRETIDDCLKVLVRGKDFACVNEYYFNLTEYLKSPEWKAEVEAKAKELGIDLPEV